MLFFVRIADWQSNYFLYCLLPVLTTPGWCWLRCVRSDVRFVNQPQISAHNGDRAPTRRTADALPQRQLRYIEWKGVQIYDFQKATFSTLFKLYIAGLGVLIPKRYHMLGQDLEKWAKKGQNFRQLVLNSAKKTEKRSQFCNRLTYRPPQYVK